ncbi:MAG TPA: YdcF family protein [Stellaceae bacterium]|nr:YdcF family protein [Stellaceae bacterium]
MAFILSKLIGILAAPGNLLTLLLVVGTLAALLSGRRLGFRLIIVAAAGFLALTVLPIGEWMLLPLENRFQPPATLPDRIDGIIVLGGGVDESLSEARGQIQLTEAGERMVIGALLARRFPSARVVLAGGSSRLFGGGPAESEAMRSYFVEEGVDPDRITIETRSRTTWENVSFAQELAKPQARETWILVTSAAHMPRAFGVFRRLGWPVLAYPVNYRTSREVGILQEPSLLRELALVTTAFHEWTGLLFYRIAGRTESLLPGPG